MQASAHAGPLLTQTSFEDAILQLKTKCIDNICLGSTAEELSKLGSLTWSEAKPTGLLTCNFYEGQTATGHFTSLDGARYNVNFDIVKEQGNILARYRLVAVGIRLSARFDSGEIYVSRWAGLLKFPPSSDKTARVMHTPDDRFSLIISSGPVTQLGFDSATLYASYNLKQQWLQTFSRCKAGGT